MFLSFLIPLSFVAIIIFLIVAIMEGKHTSKKATIIRSVYFYITSLVTLGIVVGSVIFLFNLGLKSWVFTEAESVYSRIGPPSVLFLSGDLDTRFEPQLKSLECEEECTLSTSDQEDIKYWVANYKTWQESKNNPYADRYSDLAGALSLLIIALPFFIIHYRTVRKDDKKDDDEEKKVIKPTYFYFISLASLIMIVIAGGMMINLALKTWVFPNASESNNRYLESPLIAKNINETAPVQSIIDCGEACGLDGSTVILAEQWIVDYDEWEDMNLDGKISYDNAQRQAASSIPFLIVGIPLFWYHWNIARNRKFAKGGSASGGKEKNTEEKFDEK